MHLLDQTNDELVGWLEQQRQPKFRAAQIRDWLVRQRVSSFDEMSNLPRSLQSQLSQAFQLWRGTIVREHIAEDGTEKLLLRWPDSHQVECVLLQDGERRTVCISTQVGCAMGCVFCASGIGGVERDLTTGEIIEQLLRLQQRLPAHERLSHIVVMGMGEPLANVERLLPALEFASDPKGLGISPRRITISTVGIPRAIEKLIERGSKYHLAVSLHAPTDELRNKLVPVNKSIGIRKILAAADRYFEFSGRRLTYEYVLLAGVNDLPSHAEELARQLQRRPALLNIIPYNPVDGLPYQTPSQKSLRHFKSILEDGGVNVMVRQRKGDAINAACGQLRRKFGEEFVQLMVPNSGDVVSKAE